MSVIGSNYSEEELRALLLAWSEVWTRNTKWFEWVFKKACAPTWPALPESRVQRSMRSAGLWIQIQSLNSPGEGKHKQYLRGTAYTMSVSKRLWILLSNVSINAL